MRISRSNKTFIKTQIRELTAYNPKITQLDISKRFGISRYTASKWLQELRSEQIRKIDEQQIRTEIWRMEQKGKEYLRLMSYLNSDIRHKWDELPHVMLKVYKTSWDIEKDIFNMKMNLLTLCLKADSMKRIAHLDQRIGIATVVNVER